MSRKDEVAEQTANRKQLLANGYTPLANDSKICTLKGWSRITVTEALIDEWSEQMRYRATGIRLENGVAMIDVDIDDGAVISAIVNALPDDLFEIVDKMPIRYGKGAKEAWLFRVENPFLRYASGAFAPPGQDPEGDDTVLHRIEVFGGKGGGRQMGALGAHTVKGGEVTVRYEWTDAGSPLTIRAEALPLLTEAQVAQLCDIATEVMTARGWVRHVRSKTGKTDDGGKVAFDLTEDMVFDTQEHGEIEGLTAFKGLLVGEERVRLSASWLEGPAARNKTRCIASLDHEGEVAIFETAEFLMHKPARLKPKAPPEGMADRLREMAAKGSLFSSGNDRKEPEGRVRGAEGEGLDPEDVLQDAVDILLQDYAFAPDQAAQPIYEIKGQRRFSLANFKIMCRPYAVTRRGPRGGTQTINPADIWLDSADRLEVCGRRFLPRTTELLVWSDLDNATAINLYRPAIHAAAPAQLDVWQLFMEHLLPDDRERAWFINWLAAKVQRPWLPNCGVIMVAPRQGTGRGTLFDILRGVFGGRHVRSVNSMQLMGHGGQGQYTEWLEDALLVTCDEVLAGGDTSGNMMWKRQEAYERLKTLVDPRARVASIVRKGEANYEAEVFASFLMATNNLNALPLAEDDRRLAVLRNAKQPMVAVPGLLDAVDAARAADGFKPGFLAAIYADLAGRRVDWAEAREAPVWAEQRMSMLEANKSDLDEVLESVLSELPGDYILSDDLRKRLGVAIEASGLKDELKGWWNRARDILRQNTVYGWARMEVRQHVQDRTVKEKRATVYYRDAPGVLEAWNATKDADRPPLWQDGGDLNATLSRARRVMREKGWTVE